MSERAGGGARKETRSRPGGNFPHARPLRKHSWPGECFSPGILEKRENWHNRFRTWYMLFYRAGDEQKTQSRPVGPLTDCHLGLVNKLLPLQLENQSEMKWRCAALTLMRSKFQSPGLQLQVADPPVSYTAHARRPLLPEPVLLNVNKAKIH